MTAVLPEVIIALTVAFLVIADRVLRMITGDKPRPRADNAVRGRKGTAPVSADPASGAVPGYPSGAHPYPEWSSDPATLRRLLAALREDEVQP